MLAGAASSGMTPMPTPVPVELPTAYVHTSELCIEANNQYNQYKKAFNEAASGKGKLADHDLAIRRILEKHGPISIFDIEHNQCFLGLLEEETNNQYNEYKQAFNEAASGKGELADYELAISRIIEKTEQLSKTYMNTVKIIQESEEDIKIQDKYHDDLKRILLNELVINEIQEINIPIENTEKITPNIVKKILDSAAQYMSSDNFSKLLKILKIIITYIKEKHTDEFEFDLNFYIYDKVRCEPR